MESLQEYSKYCDIIKGISDININESYRYNTQYKIVKHLNNFEENNNYKDTNKESSEIKKYSLYFQDEYNNIDKLLSLDFMEYIIPISEYLNNLINNYLLEQMIKLIDINDSNDSNDKKNISYLIDFYHFSLSFINKFYSYQEQLQILNINEKLKLKKFAINTMNNLFSYKQFVKIYNFLQYMSEDIIFNCEDKTYKDLTSISKLFLIKIKVLNKELLCNMVYYIKNDSEEFNNLKINEKLEFIIPFMNIINLIFYLLVKNPTNKK